jgi:hypothetical protein
MQWEVVFDQVAGKDLMASLAQHLDNRAASGGRLPQEVREFLDAQQRRDGDARRLVEIVPALAVWRALNLAR